FLAYNEKHKIIVVSNRGSDSFSNFMSNIFFWKTEVNWQQIVHAGFEDVYAGLRIKIQPTLKTLVDKYPDFEIIFTGHSLGGAIATMAAVDFIELYGYEYASRISLYTYGQPRIGNKEWADYVQNLPFMQRSYRIQHFGDPAVQIPFQKMGYFHSGQQYTLQSDQIKQIYTTKKCVVSGPAGESDECLNADAKKWNRAAHSQYYGWDGVCY
ncbi:Alpha/Beta hydrolase protein, partial [Globomyces pollinis-pini]